MKKTIICLLSLFFVLLMLRAENKAEPVAVSASLETTETQSLYPTWERSKIYKKENNDKVSWKSKNYAVKWWSQGDEPGTTPWGPWEEITGGNLPPANVKAAAGSTSEILVSWDAAGGAGSYEVYQSLASTSGYTKAGTVTGVTYQAGGLTEDTVYYYKVKAVYSDGVSDFSGVVSAKTEAGQVKTLIDGKTTLSAISVEGASELFTMEVPAGIKSMRTLVDALPNDFEVYGKFGAAPTASNNDWKGDTTGNEDVVFDNPLAGTWYILVVGYKGQGDYSITCTLTAAVSAPELTLTADQAEVEKGGSTTIRWSSKLAGSLTASGAWDGTKPLSGSVETGPVTQDQTYTLTAQGEGGTVSKSVTVKVKTDPVGRTDELQYTLTITREDASTFEGKVVIANPNSEYAWNGTYFGLVDFECETTSEITEISHPWGSISYVQEGNRVICKLADYVSHFEYGTTYEFTVKGNKKGDKVYLQNFSTRYKRGDMRFPDYDDLPASWQKGKLDLTAADLIKNEALYYDSNAQPISEHAVIYNPRVKTQVQIGLVPEMTFSPGLLMNGIKKLRVHVPNKYVAMGFAYGQHEFGTNPNWIAAMGIKENWTCAVTDEPGGTGPVITLDGKDYKWPMVFGNNDGPFQIEPGNFKQISTYYRDYFPENANHLDFVPITNDHTNPNWISTAITGSISVTVSREFPTADPDARYNEFMSQVKDPTAEVCVLIYAFNMGESEGTGLAGLDLFSTNREKALASTNICEDFVMYGDGDDHVPLVKKMVVAMDNETEHIYDDKIYWSDVDVFFKELRTFYANGVPTETEWTAMMGDVERAFNVLKAHWGGDYISLRYDFMTLLSVAKQYRPTPYHPRPVTTDWFYRVNTLKF